MADGRAVDVTHPETIAYSGGRAAVLLKPGDEGFEIIDLLLVVSLKTKSMPSLGNPPHEHEPSA
jgi:hypothetical protein